MLDLELSNDYCCSTCQQKEEQVLCIITDFDPICFCFECLPELMNLLNSTISFKK